MAEEKKDDLASLPPPPNPARDISIQQLITEGKNPRGIPTAKFIENVSEFLGDISVEAALGALNELYSKYKFMESSFEKSKNVYKSKGMLAHFVFTIRYVFAPII